MFNIRCCVSGVVEVIEIKRQCRVYVAFTKTLRVSGQDYQLELIDTAGQDELSIVSQSHVMNLDGYVLVYSVTSEKRSTVVSLLYLQSAFVNISS